MTMRDKAVKKHTFWQLTHDVAAEKYKGFQLI